MRNRKTSLLLLDGKHVGRCVGRQLMITSGFIRFLGDVPHS